MQQQGVATVCAAVTLFLYTLKSLPYAENYLLPSCDQAVNMMYARNRCIRYTTLGFTLLLCAAAAAALSQMQMVVTAAQPRPGYGVSASGKQFRCPKGSFNTAAAGQINCVSCPAGFTTLAEGTATAACFVRPGW
jgi:hypothetical protein